MRKNTVLTGITTTGTPHLGNYVGAIKPAIEASRNPEVQSYYFLADYHALVKNSEPARIRQSTLEIAATWLALGLDTETAVFYRQSDIPEIPELTWMLTCVTAKGLMNRAHAYKAAVQENLDTQEDADLAITMGLFASEKSNHTEELLLTSPVTIWDIVLGKYLAAAAFVAMLVVLVGFFPGLLFIYGDPEWGVTAAGLLGLLLVSLSYVAIGAFASSITSNQIIAFFVGLVILVMFLLLSVVAQLGTAQGMFGSASWLSGLLGWLATAEHFQRLSDGLIETRDLAYFAVITGSFLLLTKAAVESVRWR